MKIRRAIISADGRLQIRYLTGTEWRRLKQKLGLVKAVGFGIVWRPKRTKGTDPHA